MANKVMKITAADFEKVVRNAVNQRMKIAGAGGSPGQPYTPPKEDPNNPYVPAPTRKLAAANNIRETGGPLANDDSYGEGNVPGHPDWKLSHQGQHYGPHGRPIQDPAKGIRPDGSLIHMEHMEQSPEEHKRNKEMHIKNYGQQAGATSRQIRDRLKGFTKGKGYDESGGSLRGVPDSLRIQLLRDAMAQAPANNIRRLRDSGHKTDYTGGFRLGDDGQLIPQLGITKADANNIRRLRESGHQLVIDDNRPGNLKIIKQFKPKA